MSARAKKPALQPANPPRNERTGFKLVGITMPPWMIDALHRERFRRHESAEPNAELSAIVREAVAALLAAAPPWDADAPSATNPTRTTTQARKK